MTQLHQIAALMLGAKADLKRQRDPVYHLFKSQNPNEQGNPFDGQIRTYQPRNDNGTEFPAEPKKIRAKVPDLLGGPAFKAWAHLLDLELTQDANNAQAKADVVIDGKVLIKDAPLTFLLRFEDEVQDMLTMMTHLPVIDDDKNWTWNQGTSQFEADPVSTVKTSKEQEPLILYPHSDKHPAQTQLITKDIPIGDWTTIKISGKVTAERKQVLYERAQALLQAVKNAREVANQHVVTEKTAGKEVFAYLMAQ
jgi:hypothetical protein